MFSKIGHNFRCQSATTLALGLYLALALTIGFVHSMPYNTDCMKNPFAAGCRGISAKRSGSNQQPWNNVDAADQPVRSALEAQAGSRQAPAYEPLADYRVGQLIVAIDLVGDAVRRLARRQAQELLAQSGQDNVQALKRTLAKKGQREEAASR